MSCENVVFDQPWSRDRITCNSQTFTDLEKIKRRKEAIFKNVTQKLTKSEKFSLAAKGVKRYRGSVSSATCAN
mgnify:CR=1 FL=1